MRTLEKNLSKTLQKNKIGNEALNTLINVATAKGIVFKSENEIADYISKEFNVDVISDQVAELFALEREIEDVKINYKMCSNLEYES